MWAPHLRGEIDRRVLVNYRVDPDAIASILPAPFRPQIIEGYAVAGICLIRLHAMRPTGIPRWAGFRSENAAHRVAVEWGDPGSPKSGVYIPRRDSNSWTNIALGGRIYPGEHHRARFAVAETPEEIHVEYASNDGSAKVDVQVRLAPQLTDSELFDNLEDASAFFERGSIGYSATPTPTRFDGLQLQTAAWQVEPAIVLQAHSSFFQNELTFPPGTATLDCAWVMRKVPVEWLPLQRLDNAARSAI